jgi:hypothetical protein
LESAVLFFFSLFLFLLLTTAGIHAFPGDTGRQENKHSQRHFEGAYIANYIICYVGGAQRICSGWRQVQLYT